MDTISEQLDSVPATSTAPKPRRLLFRILLGLLGFMTLVALSLAGPALVITLLGAQTYRWRAFDVEVSLAPAREGVTRLIFTPLGEVRAPTHTTPVALKIRLQSILFERMKQLLLKPPPRDELERDFTQTAERSLRHFARKQIALGALGALIAPLLLRPRKLRYWLLPPLIGGGFVALLFTHAVRTFDRTAFNDPIYTGSLREANWIIALVKDGFNKAEALSDKLRTVARNLNRLYGRISAAPGPIEDMDVVRVLHISDIHNNPVAVDFVQELAEKFQVDVVVDTGDLTDFGTPLENQLSGVLARLPVPYLFVAGNHDSQATVRAVRSNRKAVILDGKPVEVAGLTFLGLPDPASARPDVGSVDTPEEAIAAAGGVLLERFQRASPPPDIVCVHNPRQVAPLVGVAPVILCGHMHRQYVQVEGRSVLCNAGTTGAAGLRYLDRKEGVPFSAAILTFSRLPQPRLLFIDQVALDGSLQEYSIHRRSFQRPSEAPTGPPPPQEVPSTL